MDKFRVALSSDFKNPDGTPAYPMFDLSPLQHPNIEYHFLKCSDTIDAAELTDVDALILLGHKFTPRSVPDNQRLAIIARFGVGYDTVDVASCNENGIALVITPSGVRRPVAVTVLTFMLALMSKLMIKNRIARQGPKGWARRADYMGTGVTGKTLGILGFGNIGAEIVYVTKPLGMKYIAHDPFTDTATAAELGVSLVSLETLFEQADVLSVNCLLNDTTHHIVNAERLAMMKPTAFLINTSRGPTVDEQALVEALRAEQIAGAGLDVFAEEPTPADNPLFNFENVIVAPHSLCWTDECFSGNGAADIDAVLQVMQGRSPEGIVNSDIANSRAWLGKLENYQSRFGN